MIKEIIDQEDFKQAAKLAEICFHERSKDDNLKYFKKLKELYFIGYFEEEKLLASVGNYAFQIYVRGKLLSCAGIAHVMTDPIHRKKGYVRKLMNNLITKNFKEGYDITTLWPFMHGFYQKFGYEICEKTITYKFSPSDIKKKFKIDERVKIREVLEEKDYEVLIKITQEAQNKFTRIIGEKDAWTLRGPEEKFSIFVFERATEPIGYISLKFHKPKKGEWETNIRIVDFAYVDKEIKHSIFGFLRNFESDISKIVVNLPYEEEIMNYLDDIKEEHKFAQWPPMSRILNVKSSLEKLDFPKTENAILFAEIEDEIIDENNGIWRLKFEGGKCSAQKIVKSECEEKKILRFKIGKFTQLVVGVIGIKNLFEANSDDIPEEWIKKNIFPIQPCKIGVWF